MSVCSALFYFDSLCFARLRWAKLGFVKLCSSPCLASRLRRGARLFYNLQSQDFQHPLPFLNISGGVHVENPRRIH
jgi:hypothetical protein